MSMYGFPTSFDTQIPWKPTMKRPVEHMIAAGGSVLIKAWIELDSSTIYTFPTEMYFHFYGPGDCSETLVELGAEEFVFDYNPETHCISPQRLQFIYSSQEGDLDDREQQRKDTAENKKRQMLGDLFQKIAEKQNAKQIVQQTAAQQIERLEKEIAQLESHCQRIEKCEV